MLLTLEVISANGDALGDNRRKTVGPEGARIGRSRDCDWVINDQYISRVHAQVRCVGGAFYIEGLGRNLLALNDPQQPIPNNEPQLLRSGDRVFLDEYEIVVTTSAGAAAGRAAAPVSPPPIVGDPFAAETPAPIPSGASRSWDLGIVDAGLDESSSLDPLAALGGTPARPQAPLPPVNIHQGSVLEDHYQPPPAASANKIPDAWDRSGFTQMGQQPSGPAPSKPPPRPTAPAKIPVSSDSSIPDTWDKSRLPAMERERASAAAKSPLDVQPRPSTGAPTTRMPPPRETAPGARGAPQRSHTVRRPIETAAAPPAQPDVQPPVRRPAERAEAPPPGATAGNLDLEELLRAAGLTGQQMSPELARELGQVLRIVVQGVMEVLQSRAEIKSQLRMSMTRMQATENNPLKFSPNVEAALHTLLVERNRGYLPTTRAFQEALTDIRNHQIAVLQGIRSAYDSMLEHFDPERLGEDFDRQAKRSGGLLNLGAKARFRDCYVEHYQSMTRDPDASFRQLFGEYFAEAYEEQMDRLKAAGRTAGDT